MELMPSTSPAARASLRVTTARGAERVPTSPRSIYGLHNDAKVVLEIWYRSKAADGAAMGTARS